MEPNYVLPTESHFKHNDIDKLKLKEWNKKSLMLLSVSDGSDGQKKCHIEDTISVRRYYELSHIQIV